MWHWSKTFTCACGCAATIHTLRYHDVHAKLYASNACRQRAYRRRRVTAARQNVLVPPPP